jgi:hypothetical protein
MSKQITIRAYEFYCYQDEKHFFSWLKTIKGIEQVTGAEKQLGLTLTIKDTGLNADDWADLIGLLMRYSVDMSPLRELVTPEHEAWLRGPKAYWHQKLWGETAPN